VEVADPAYDDSGWDTLPVPSHWVLHGDGAYGRPSYTNISYPFPIDPPRVPDENPTGDHRRTFDAPDWAISAEVGARVLLRFDGVESVYRVWLNGTEIGVGKGSRLVAEFDVTGVLRPGPNVLVVRVHQWSSMSYLEDQDQWWLPGIFRDVTLLGRPRGAVDDVWLECGYDAVTGTGWVRPQIGAAADAFPLTLELPELGVRHALAGPGAPDPVPVGPVEPWSAEAPRLYEATLAAAGEQISLRVGFRTVEVIGDRLLVNGRQLIFRGMNRHETHPERGRVFDETNARADLVQMKAAGVNAVRTSHYPPHPRVLDLADELGFWVVDECDLETHGFVDLDWRGNPSDDPRYAASYLDRIERTFERDKNHACVVMWSLGNEAGTGQNLAEMASWLHRRDPGRPVHYEGDHTGAYTDVYSRMYPNLVELAAIGGESGPLEGCGPGEAVRVRRLPHLMCEYGHAMGNGPGALAEYDAVVESFGRLHGGFIWEWRDHGLLTRTPDGTEFYGYGGDFGEVVHDGNFVMDGMVLPHGTPTPGLAEFAAVNAPVVLRVDPAGSLTVRNRYHALDTAHLRFLATVELDGREDTRAEVPVPPVEAGASVEVALPEDLRRPRPGGETWLTVRAELATDTAWAAAGHAVAWTQRDLTVRPPHRQGGPPAVVAPSRPASEDEIVLGPARFDARTGRLRTLHGVAVQGPAFELWRGPTDNDRSGTRGSFELASPEATGGEGAPGPSSAQRWRERGLDRLLVRTEAVRDGGDTLEVRTRVGAADSGQTVDVTYLWYLEDAATVWLRVAVVPSLDWDCTWPRVGIRLDLPAALTRASWFGTGPGESYPDSRTAARVGRFSATVDELNVAYSRPQETGHRADLRDLEVRGGDGQRLRVVTRPDRQGHRPGFTLTRHTPHDLDRARHPYELPPHDQVFLYLDDAVHGLGSRSCGIDVLPQHALWPGARAFTLGFPAPA